jgi:hypothetical protein
VCVIAVCFTNRLTLLDIEEMEYGNPHGIGIAWASGSGDARKVNWRKGIAAEEIANLADVVPLPYMVHTRFATVGDKVPQLAHPYPIEKIPSEYLAGDFVGGSVLMHNGHASEYQNIARTLGIELDGNWSDSRVMAAAVAHNGSEILGGFSRWALLHHTGQVELIGTWHHEEGRAWSVARSSFPIKRYHYAPSSSSSFGGCGTQRTLGPREGFVDLKRDPDFQLVKERLKAPADESAPQETLDAFSRLWSKSTRRERKRILRKLAHRAGVPIPRGEESDAIVNSPVHPLLVNAGPAGPAEQESPSTQTPITGA